MDAPRFVRLPPALSMLALLGLLMAAVPAAGDDRARLERAYFAAVEEAPAGRFARWLRLVQGARALPRAEQLERVNRFFNELIRPVPDEELWGLAEYWATPMETLALGAGDCDDIAIAKYFTLRSLGVPPAHLRLYYVFLAQKDGREQPHLVLGYQGEREAHPLILDNVHPSIESLPARRDLDPVAAFGSDAVYRLTRGQQVRSPVHRAQRWASVLVRAQAEGFAVDFPPAATAR